MGTVIMSTVITYVDDYTRVREFVVDESNGFDFRAHSLGIILLFPDYEQLVPIHRLLGIKHSAGVSDRGVTLDEYLKDKAVPVNTIIFNQTIYRSTSGEEK